MLYSIFIALLLSIDAWAALLARNVAELAEHSEAARLALARLLGM